MTIEQDAIQLISHATTLGISDIHILPTAHFYHVYFRQNGQLEPIQQQSLDWGKRLISYFKFQANMDIGEKRRPQSGATHWQHTDTPTELRFSTISNVHLMESLVIRVIQPQQTVNHQIQTYFPQDITCLQQLIRHKSGLILFSGPVGSGKTTTIYQLLRERLQEEMLQIITMEDPVEILEPHFLQTQVNELAGISYDLLIKAALRHHPDILMIGEIRDEETARMTIRGALTGHLLIATIHAKNALGVIARLQELRITDAQLSQTLIGIISQRLVPRYCPLCQGRCQRYCQHYPQSAKRYALFEILSGEALQQQLLQLNTSYPFHTLNQKLGKAWAYGYIHHPIFTQFEVV